MLCGIPLAIGEIVELLTKESIVLASVESWQFGDLLRQVLKNAAGFGSLLGSLFGDKKHDSSRLADFDRTYLAMEFAHTQGLICIFRPGMLMSAN